MKGKIDGKYYLLPIEMEGIQVIARQFRSTGYFRIYKLPLDSEELESMLTEDNAFFGTYVTLGIVKQAKWKLLGNKPWSPEETRKIPCMFRQSPFNFNDCMLVHPAVPDAMKASYQNCIGLDRAGIMPNWEYMQQDLIARIKGVPNEPWTESERLKIPGVDIPS